MNARHSLPEEEISEDSAPGGLARWLPGAVLLAALACTALVVWYSNYFRVRELRHVTADMAADHAFLMREQIDRALSAAYAMGALVRQGYGELEEFESIAAEMLPLYKGVGALQLAPGGVISRVVPLEGNEVALGLDLLKDPERGREALRAVQSRELTLSGPFQLVQGGPGLVGRLPIFLDGPYGPRFWGFTMVLMRVDDLLAAASMNQMQDQGYRYRLSRRDPQTGAWVSFAESMSGPPVDPVSVDLPVPNAEWRLEAAPVGGWQEGWRIAAESLVGVLASLLVYWRLRVGARLPVLLRRRVAARTAELRAANESLHQELVERARIEDRLRKLTRAVEQSPATVVITDLDGHIEYVNPKFTELTGYSPEEAIGQTPRLINSGLTPQAVYEDLWQSLRAGREWRGELLNRKKSGELFWESEIIAPVRDADGTPTHFLAVKEDVTARKHAEDGLRRANRTLSMLSRCNEALVRTASEQALLDSVCAIAVETGGYPVAWVGLLDAAPGAAPRLRTAAWAQDEAVVPGALRLDELDCEATTGPVQRALSSDAAELERDLEAEAACAACGKWRSAAVRSGCRSRVVLPLLGAGAKLGVLSIYAGEADAFDEAELRLLKELAEDLGYGIAARRTALDREEARRSLRLHERAIESSFDAIIITDATLPDKPVVFANAAFERITGYPVDEVLGRNARLLLRNDLAQIGLTELRALLREHREGTVELRCYRKDGTTFWCEASVAPVCDEHGRITHTVSVLNDITERRRFEEQILHQSTHDALTGLANRSLFDDRLRQEICHAGRSEHGVVVLVVDLDNFKRVNEGLGAGVGDLLLQEMATRLGGAVRGGDTVARLGADEFGIVLTDMACCGDVAPVADKLRAVIARPFSTAGGELVVTASMGMSVFPVDGDSAELLLRNADLAMYAAKREGRGLLCRYDASMDASVSLRLELEAELRQALDAREFCLHFQPKVDLASGAIVGAEALLRWQHARRGLVPPGDFIPVAEESALILPIGEWVVDEACRQIREWQAAGLDVPPIAVNLSARQFRDPRLAEMLSGAIGRYDVSPALLDVEITESMVMERPELAAATLARIKAIGVKIALDDFGTGYSSLAYLKRFPINLLKIDRAFVRDITEKPEDAAITRAVIAMAHSLGIAVVAEGVESEGQLNYLREHQCDQIQGYLFSRPLPAAAFADMLGEHRRLPMRAPGEPGAERTLLIVDDEQNVLAALKRVLRREGYAILTASSGREALELLASQAVQVVVSDQRMPEMSGTELLHRVRQLHPDTVRIVLSGYTELSAITDAINRGAIYKFLTKPWEDVVLRDTIREAFRLHASRKISRLAAVPAAGAFPDLEENTP